LGTEQPWRDIDTLAEDLAEIRKAYASERRRLIERQEEVSEQGRRDPKRREGFSTLTAEQAHDLRLPGRELVTEADFEALVAEIR
jgi:hypothetical protein